MTTFTQAVIVTGGGTGIGRSTAQAFADGGAGVLVVGRSALTLAQTAKGRGTIRPLALDITQPEAAKTIVDTAVREFGRVDVLVNNAAIGSFGGLASLDPKAVGPQFDTNLIAPIFLTQAALEPLAHSRGVVVNVSSAGAQGLRSWPDNAVYGASKAGLDFLTRSWAVELAPRGIRVVGIAPGVVNTGVGVRAGLPQEAYDGFLEHMRSRIPSARVGTPEEIASWIVHLARAEAAYANGTVFVVDGALSVT